MQLSQHEQILENKRKLKLWREFGHNKQLYAKVLSGEYYIERRRILAARQNKPRLSKKEIAEREFRTRIGKQKQIYEQPKITYKGTVERFLYYEPAHAKYSKYKLPPVRIGRDTAQTVKQRNDKNELVRLQKLKRNYDYPINFEINLSNVRQNYFGINKSPESRNTIIETKTNLPKTNDNKHKHTSIRKLKNIDIDELGYFDSSESIFLRRQQNLNYRRDREREKNKINPFNRELTKKQAVEHFSRLSAIQNKIDQIKKKKTRFSKLTGNLCRIRNNADWLKNEIKYNPLQISIKRTLSERRNARIAKPRKSIFSNHIIREKVHRLAFSDLKINQKAVARKTSDGIPVGQTLRELEEEEKRWYKHPVFLALRAAHKQQDIEFEKEHGVKFLVTDKEYKETQKKKQRKIEIIRRCGGKGDDWDCLNGSLIKERKIKKETDQIFREQRDRERRFSYDSEQDWYERN